MHIVCRVVPFVTFNFYVISCHFYHFSHDIMMSFWKYKCLDIFDLFARNWWHFSFFAWDTHTFPLFDSPFDKESPKGRGNHKTNENKLQNNYDTNQGQGIFTYQINFGSQNIDNFKNWRFLKRVIARVCVGGLINDI